MSLSFRRQRWTYRLIAIGSILGAAFSLYLAGREVAIKILTHKIERHLTQTQVKSQWAKLSWKGRGLCADGIKLEHIDRVWAGEAEELCVKLTFVSQWPGVAAEDIWISRPRLWIHEWKSTRLSGRGQSLSTSSSPRLLGYSLARLDQHLVDAQHQWQKIWQQLKLLGSHQVHVAGLSIYLSSKRRTDDGIICELFFSSSIGFLSRACWCPPPAGCS